MYAIVQSCESGNNQESRLDPSTIVVNSSTSGRADTLSSNGAYLTSYCPNGIAREREAHCATPTKRCWLPKASCVPRALQNTSPLVCGTGFDCLGRPHCGPNTYSAHAQQSPPESANATFQWLHALLGYSYLAISQVLP